MTAKLVICCGDSGDSRCERRWHYNCVAAAATTAAISAAGGGSVAAGGAGLAGGVAAIAGEAATAAVATTAAPVILMVVGGLVLGGAVGYGLWAGYKKYIKWETSLKTHLDKIFLAPPFDLQIVDWLEKWTADPYDYGGPPLRVGIIASHDGQKTVYRAIDGDGSMEMRSVYEFLESIGLSDLQIYDHPRFNCIYGLAGDRLASGEKFSVTALSR